jgi:hypothetical protein
MNTLKNEEEIVRYHLRFLKEDEPESHPSILYKVRKQDCSTEENMLLYSIFGEKKFMPPDGINRRTGEKINLKNIHLAYWRNGYRRAIMRLLRWVNRYIRLIELGAPNKITKSEKSFCKKEIKDIKKLIEDLEKL